mgnify:CR=1 FL=1
MAASIIATHATPPESLLFQSFECHLKQIEKEKKSAASDAFDLAGIKSLKLDYQGALKYYNKAVELDPKNSLYLNDLGIILNILGEYQKAIDYYEKAESILKIKLGEDHPYTERVRDNIDGLVKSRLKKF